MLIAALLLLALAGCGGRPSEDDLSEALQDEDNAFLIYLGAYQGPALSPTGDEEAADCMAEVLHDSDMSDDGLQLIADNDLERPRIAGSISAAAEGDKEFSDDDFEELKKILGDLRECSR